MRRFLLFIGALLLFSSCSRTYDCSDVPLIPAFLRFQPSDLDTLVIKKYEANSNFQKLVDSFNYIPGNTHVVVSQDTILVYALYETNKTILPGFDWQIYIPAKNRVVLITDIVREIKTGTCGAGIFSMEKFGCDCTNPLISCRKDNQVTSFPTTDSIRNFLYIEN